MKKPRFRGTMTHALRETYYGDLSVTNQDAQRRVEWLQKHGADDLANALRGCRSKDRCLTPACTMCGRAEQHVMTGAFKDLAERYNGKLEIGFANIVPVRFQFAPGNLKDFDIVAMQRMIRDRIAKTDAVFATGGIDLTVNRHKEGAWPLHWQATGEVLIGAKNLKGISDQLSPQFGKSDSVLNPVKIYEWDGNDRLFPYLSKPNAHRRVTNPNGRRFNKSTGTWRTCKVTSPNRLVVAEEIEFLRFLHNVGIGGRLICRNVSLRHRDGELRFVEAS